MRRSILSITLSLLFVAFTVPQAHATEKVPYYFTVHVGMLKYDVNDTVNRWNRNPTVELVRVNTCAGYFPCVDIWEKYGDTTAQENHYAGLFYTPNKDFWAGPIFDINLYTWWHYQWPKPEDLNAVRKHILCHELGHYLLGPISVPHPDAGCLSEVRWFNYPGEYNKAHVTDWWHSYNGG